MTYSVRGHTVRVPQLLAVSLAAVLLATAVVAAGTSPASFGSHNAAWDGARDLRVLADDRAETVLVQNTTQYSAAVPNESVAFVLAPDRTYRPAAAARVEQFVRAGGTLVVAGDFGAATNPLLADLGVESRVNGTLLRDERSYAQAPTFPVADNVTATPLTRNVSRLTLNHGSAIDPGSAARVLVRSSAYAYLDTTPNDQLDENETLARHPVAVVESVGDGRVVVVSDPSIFINSMLDQPDNRRFAVALVGDADTVLFDYSHARSFPPLVAALLAVRRSVTLQVGVALALAGALAAWAHRSPLRALRARLGDDDRPTPGLSPDELADVLARRHPDWDRDRVERVTEGIISRRTEGGDDG